MTSRKILVVDDEQSARNLYKSAFEKNGYEVFTAETGEEALEIVENETIYVMFLDLVLPGMDGEELCRRILKKAPVSILFAVTGYSSHFELADCKAAGFEDYFRKPVPLEKMFEAVEAAFETIDRWKNIH